MTLWLAERGQGSAPLFIAAAGAIGVEMVGRALPPGADLGARLKGLRIRMGISRRELATATGLSRTTIAAFESGRLGHLSVLERIGEALNAGLSLVPKGQGPAFYGSVALSSGWDAWASPQELLNRLYECLATPVDLDPCSPGRTRCRVRAAAHYTEDDDGLGLPWHGRVYMNPPYGREIGRWTAKARTEVEAGRALVVIGLLPARTDTQWWHRDVAGRAHVCLLRGRLSFGDGSRMAPFPSALVAWGADQGLRIRLSEAFAEHWYVPIAPAEDQHEPDLAAD